MVGCAFVGCGSVTGVRGGVRAAKWSCSRLLVSRSGRQRRCSVQMNAASEASPEVDDGPKKVKKTFGGIIGVWWALMVTIVAVTIYIPMVIVHPLVKLMDNSRRRFHDFLSRCFLKLPMYLIGNAPEIINREKLPSKDETVVYVANHQSYLDIFCFGFLDLHHKFISKIEILSIPVIGTSSLFASSALLCVHEEKCGGGGGDSNPPHARARL